MSALCAGGIVRHGALCYTARRICAALRAAMTAKNFRTRAAAKRRGISFAPQKYFFMQSAQGIPTQGFQNHIPARGRKRAISPYNLFHFRKISKPHPRKGTETTLLLCAIRHDQSISKPHPRKGTETVLRRGTRYAEQFQNDIPARGRKLASKKQHPLERNIKFQNHIPARGRKRADNGRKIWNVSNGNFKTISPQGDGNTSTAFLPSSQGISKPYPRKGTETITECVVCKLIPEFQNHIPARGRKHGVNFLLFMLPINNFKTTSPQGDGNFHKVKHNLLNRVIFQNHIPARGRKHHARRMCGAHAVISKPYPRKGTETHST